jgi:excisionase family DNA binding protein
MTGRPLGSKGKERLTGSSLMTVKEVCGHLRIHRSTLYGMIKAGGIPHFRVGREYRFDREEIDVWSGGAKTLTQTVPKANDPRESSARLPSR